MMETKLDRKLNDDLEKFECEDCGCYFWVENRNDFGCPNCFQRIIDGELEK